MHRKSIPRVVHVQEDCDKWLSTTNRPKKQNLAPPKRCRSLPKMSRPVARTYQIEFTSSPLEIKATKQTSIAAFCHKKARIKHGQHAHEPQQVKQEQGEPDVFGGNSDESEIFNYAPFPSLGCDSINDEISDQANRLHNSPSKIQPVRPALNKLTTGTNKQTLCNVTHKNSSSGEHFGTLDHSDDLGNDLYNDFDYVLSNPDIAGNKENSNDSSQYSQKSTNIDHIQHESGVRVSRTLEYSRNEAVLGKRSNLRVNVTESRTTSPLRQWDGCLLPAARNDPEYSRTDLTHSGDSQATLAGSESTEHFSGFSESESLEPVASGRRQLLELDLEFDLHSGGRKASKFVLHDQQDSDCSRSDDSQFTFRTQRRPSGYRSWQDSAEHSPGSQEGCGHEQDSPFTFHTQKQHRQKHSPQTRAQQDNIPFTFHTAPEQPSAISGSSFLSSNRRKQLHSLKQPDELENSDSIFQGDLDTFTFHTQKRKRNYSEQDCSSSDDLDLQDTCHAGKRQKMMSNWVVDHSHLSSEEETDSQIF